MPTLRLPTTGETALIAGFVIYLILFPVLGYKGFAYMAGTIFFALGLRWQIERLAQRETISLGFYWWSFRMRGLSPSKWEGKSQWKCFTLPMPSEAVLTKRVGQGLVFSTIFLLPIAAFVAQRQGVLFSAQLDHHMPAMLAFLDDQMAWVNAQLGTQAQIDVDGGLSGLKDTLGHVAGTTINDLKEGLKGVVGSLLKLFGVILADYVLLCISAIIVAMIINSANWKKEVAFFRKRVERGIQNPVLRARVLRWGELFQEAIGLFMVGYLEVGLRLSALFFLAIFVLTPLGIGFGAALFVSILLGFVTAIPKIGGFVGLLLAVVLMGLNLEPGLGWFGIEMFTTGSVGGDVVVRIVLLAAIAKVMGLFEAYRFTPEIIGDRLGLTKLLIVATVLMAAKAGGFFGMIWGILAMLAWQAFKRLDEEVEQEAAAGKDGSAADAA
mgnify:CR=1 FL=1